MTSPSFEQPRHSRGGEADHGGDHHEPTTGPIPIPVSANPMNADQGLDEHTSAEASAENSVAVNGGGVDESPIYAGVIADHTPETHENANAVEHEQVPEDTDPSQSGSEVTAPAEPMLPPTTAPTWQAPAGAPQIPEAPLPAPPTFTGPPQPAFSPPEQFGPQGHPPPQQPVNPPWQDQRPPAPQQNTWQRRIPAQQFEPSNHFAAPQHQPAQDPPSLPQQHQGVAQVLQPGDLAASVRAQRPAPGLERNAGNERLSETRWNEELVTKKKPAPESGWRSWVYKGTFKLINLGRSQMEKDLDGWLTTIASPLRGEYKVAIAGVKGGTGKSTTSASVGSVFAQVRKGDRVVAVDADPGYGTLGDRIDPEGSGHFGTVLADANAQLLNRISDMRAHVGENKVGLHVLAGDPTLENRPPLLPETYTKALAQLVRFYPLLLVDCGPEIDHPVTRAVLDEVNAMIVVASTKADGAKGAGLTLDWLAANGYMDLLTRTVVVISDQKGNSGKELKKKLQQRFAGTVDDVFVVPFDPHLDEAGVIDINAGLKPKTRRKFIEIAAAIAANFARTSDQRHD